MQRLYYNIIYFYRTKNINFLGKSFELIKFFIKLN